MKRPRRGSEPPSGIAVDRVDLAAHQSCVSVEDHSHTITLPPDKGDTMSKAKTSAIKEKQTKSAIIAHVAEDTGLTKKQV
jgi:hypothetical protein